MTTPEQRDIRRQRKRLTSRRRRFAAAAALISFLIGVVLIGGALASQPEPPKPVAAAASDPTGTELAAVLNALEEWAPATAATPGVVGPTMPRSKPVSMQIASIGVSSKVRSLGLEADGTLEVPEGKIYDDAAWYRHSPTPGSLGPAILLGHVDSKAHGPSVFYRLSELKPGARITVTRQDRSVAIFEVDKVRTYAKKNFPTDTVYNDIDHAGLRILTCGGAFDASAGSYVDNTVIFASLVDTKGL